MDRIRELTERMTPEEMARLLLRTVAENCKLRDEIHEARYRLWWYENGISRKTPPGSE